MTAIEENLTQARDQWRLLGAGIWVAYDFILAHGQFYQGQKLSGRYRRRAPKACFYNARRLVLAAKRLVYCEGYAMGTQLPFPFEHAWAIDSAGRVIDPTLRGPQDYQFFGIRLGREWLKREWRYTGVLRSEVSFRPEVLKAIDPEWYSKVLEPLLL
jgi:hypothetical protein